MVETMFSTKRYAPWHKVGERVEGALTSQEALVKAGLDWNVGQQEIYVDGNVVDGYKANVRSSDGSVLGIVSDKYTIVQNREAFAFTDKLLGEGVNYEVVGSLNRGRKVWMLANMPEISILGEKHTPHLAFTNTHDGSGAVRVSVLTERLMCSNVIGKDYYNNANRSWSVRHVGDLSDKIDNAQETLNLTNRYVRELIASQEMYAEQSINDEAIDVFVNELFPYPVKDITNKKLDNVKSYRDEFINCYNADDIKRFKGTKLGVLQAIADYVTHIQPKRFSETFSENQFDKLINGHSMVDKAYKIINNI